MSDPTAPVEGAPASTPEAPAAPQYDTSAIVSRMDELGQNIGQFSTRFDALEQRLPAPPEPEAPVDPWAALMADPQDPNAFDPYGQPAVPQAPQFDPQALQAAVNQAIAQQNAPLLQKLQAFELKQAESALYAQIPQLKPVPPGHADYATNQAARQQAATLVQTALAAYPPQIAQALQNDPNFIATHWKAAEADRLAQGQAPAGGQAPSLEAAGGALPGGNSEPVNPVTQAFANRPPGLPAGFGR